MGLSAAQGSARLPGLCLAPCPVSSEHGESAGLNDYVIVRIAEASLFPRYVPALSAITGSQRLGYEVRPIWEEPATIFCCSYNSYLI